VRGNQLGLYGGSAPTSGAAISPCGRYRYALWRRWGNEADGPCMAWVMLNPSTADASVDDPTIRRCAAFARSWGYAGMRVVNLFAWRATNPAELSRVADPVGPENDRYLERIDDRFPLVVAAWGRHGSLRRRDFEAARILTRTHDVCCLRVTLKSRAPEHPLYVPGSARPELFVAKGDSLC
jgi:hypothetical protein